MHFYYCSLNLSISTRRDVCSRRASRRDVVFPSAPELQIQNHAASGVFGRIVTEFCAVRRRLLNRKVTVNFYELSELLRFFEVRWT